MGRGRKIPFLDQRHRFDKIFKAHDPSMLHEIDADIPWDAPSPAAG